MKWLLVTIVLGIASQVQGQSLGPVSPESRPEMHQLFLKEPVQKIEILEYRESGEPIEHESAPDGKTIYLRGYDGKSPVSVMVINKDGERETFVRSRCDINAYVPEL